VHNYIGNNAVVKAAAEVAARDGFAPMVLTTQNIGEAEVAKT
jgi:hypothetical protein